MKEIRIKFCGMTRRQDLEAAISLGADLIGMIFYPQSPRHISPAAAQQLCEGLTFKKTLKAGVFVNSTCSEILHTVSTVGLDVIQLHGDDGAERIPELQQQTRAGIWKTVRVRDRNSLESIRQSDQEFFLIDTFSATRYGGTGKRLDLTLIEEACRIQEGRKKIIVAGGLGPHNLKAILPLSPWGVDINSGVETSPGIKDHRLMKETMDILRGYRSGGTPS